METQFLDALYQYGYNLNFTAFNFMTSKVAKREQKPEFQTVNLIYKLLAYRIVSCILHVTEFHLNGHEPSGSFSLRGTNKAHGLCGSVLSPLLRLILDED